MSVWYCIPSAKPAAEAQECVNAWRAMGYSVAVMRDEESPEVDADLAIFILYMPYPGYANAVNLLALSVLGSYPECDWIVTGGDDTWPDRTKQADGIASECRQHFGGTFGVMQPTGDGHGADKICGSPWLGRDYCLRVNGGHGPLWPQYKHMFVDEECQAVAQKLGVLWHRPDLRHEHRHWSFTGKPMPDYIAHANTREHWLFSQQLFSQRKSRGFPGHEPVPVQEAVSA